MSWYVKMWNKKTSYSLFYIIVWSFKNAWKPINQPFSLAAFKAALCYQIPKKPPLLFLWLQEIKTHAICVVVRRASSPRCLPCVKVQCSEVCVSVWWCGNTLSEAHPILLLLLTHCHSPWICCLTALFTHSPSRAGASSAPTAWNQWGTSSHPEVSVSTAPPVT